MLQEEEQPLIWRVAANIMNKQLQTYNRWWLSSLGFGQVLTTPQCKNWPRYKMNSIATGLGLILGYNLRNEKGT